MESNARAQARGAGWLAAAGIAAAVLSSACCVVPLGLFALGISGAWIGNLTALEPYKPWFLAFAVAAIAGGFLAQRRRRAAACASEGYCGTPLARRVTTGVLLLAVVIVIVAAAWPLLVPVLLG